jgi:hypothetical protein
MPEEMTMPIVIAPFVSFLFGVIAALALPAERSADEARARRLVWLCAAMSLAPNVVYFLSVTPDWSVAYLLNAGRIPAALLFLGGVGVTTLASLSHDIALRWIHNGQTRRAVVVAAAVGVLGLTISGVLARRFWVVASIAEYREGSNLSTLGSSLQGLAVVLLNVLTTVGALVTLSNPSRATPSGGARLIARAEQNPDELLRSQPLSRGIARKLPLGETPKPPRVR